MRHAEFCHRVPRDINIPLAGTAEDERTSKANNTRTNMHNISQSRSPTHWPQYFDAIKRKHTRRALQCFGARFNANPIQQSARTLRSAMIRFFILYLHSQTLIVGVADEASRWKIHCHSGRMHEMYLCICDRDE